MTRLIQHTIAITLLLFGGCRMGSPIHVWTPPQIQSAVGKRIAVPEIVGDKSLADKIHAQLLAAAPRDAGRAMTLFDARMLQPKSSVQLASASGTESNDVALASVARREGYDYVLRGEIIEQRAAENLPLNRLTVSWRLMSLDPNHPHLSGEHVGGQPIVVDLATATAKHPDLALLPDAESILAAAVARESQRLIAPTIRRDRVQLAIPYVGLGSRETRRGNALALTGNWGEAEGVWQAVYDKHPSQIAALQNLAIAAAAAQDFSRAKQLIRTAIRKRPTSFAKETLVWIELRQRDYHAAFGLPDPPEGWYVTSAATPSLRLAFEPGFTPAPKKK